METAFRMCHVPIQDGQTTPVCDQQKSEATTLIPQTCTENKNPVHRTAECIVLPLHTLIAEKETLAPQTVLYPASGGRPQTV
eukprot:4426441-Amphidinium_carterae.1